MYGALLFLLMNSEKFCENEVSVSVYFVGICVYVGNVCKKRRQIETYCFAVLYRTHFIPLFCNIVQLFGNICVEIRNAVIYNT